MVQALARDKTTPQTILSAVVKTNRTVGRRSITTYRMIISTRRLAVAATAGMILPFAAFAVKPYKPDLKASFSLDSQNKGVMHIGVTAPTAESVKTGSMWYPQESAGDPLPEETRMTVTVTRSCSSLGETKISVLSMDDVAPGQVLDFTDDQTEYPLQIGYSYTYYCKAAIVTGGTAEESTEVYTSVKFGLTPDMPSDCEITENADGSVTISLTAPSTYNSTEQLPVELDVMEIYRLGEWDEKPKADAEPFAVINAPAKGETVVFTDTDPAVNSLNKWYVNVKCELGENGKKYSTWVGYDKPRPASDIKATLGSDGVSLAWKAPVSGQDDYNGSKFDPSQTRFRVYRMFGYSQDSWVMIAEDLTETSYFDSGEDLTEPVKINYAVVAYNNVGVGTSAYPAGTYANSQPFVVGPKYILPFEENVSEDKKTDKLWMVDNNSGEWEFRKPFVVGSAYDPTARVEGPDGAGVLGTNYTYGYNRANVRNVLTSHYMDLSEAASPELKLSYYAIPANDTHFEVSAIADGDTVVLSTIKISEGIKVNEFSWDNDNWREVTIDLGEYAGVGDFRIAVACWYESQAHAAMISRVSIVDKGEEKGVFIVDGVKYEVIPPADQIAENNSDTLPVEKVAAVKYVGASTEATVPLTVNGYGTDYLVERVAERAFAGNANVREVSVAAYAIDESAFEGSESLAKVSLLETVAVIGPRAFAACPGLQRVEFHSTPVPEVAADAFSGIHENCTGSCPAEAYADYTAHEALKPITFDPPTSVGLVFDGASEADVFTLDGVCVMRGATAGEISALAPGIYLVRAGGRTVKTVIR